jgi:prepilin-type N-terminal cleavage/methylation domain-containing protein
MKKDKGFTLIELLAIIVILAIIAVITVPIILDVIEKSRKGAAFDSVYGITDTAKLYFYKSDGSGTTLANYTCDFTKGCNELHYDGETPTSGTIRMNEKGFVSGEVTYYDKYTFCIYNNSVYEGTCQDTVVPDFKEKIKTPGETHIYDPDGKINSNMLMPCVQFDITVKTGTTIPFCVIGETENTVTLMAKDTVGAATVWGGGSNNSAGPNDAMTALLSGTSDWTNIPLIASYTYDDTAGGTKTYGYTGLSISEGILTLTNKAGTQSTIGDSSNKFRARLATSEEIQAVTKGKAFDWMGGTWTISSDGRSNNEAYRVLQANLSNPTLFTTYVIHDSEGLKPVITIAKTSL